MRVASEAVCEHHPIQVFADIASRPLIHRSDNDRRDMHAK